VTGAILFPANIVIALCAVVVILVAAPLLWLFGPVEVRS
jgi:hypothetical protein